MFGTQPCDPYCISGKRSFQRFYFADKAALLAIVYRFIKCIGPLFCNKFFKKLVVRIVSFYTGAVFFIGAAPNRIGFCKEAARIEREYFNGEIVIKNFVGDHLVFVAEAGRKNNLAGELTNEQ